MFEKLKIPGNTMIITKELIKIATFDLIPTDFIDEIVWYFPESEAFSLNFETAGVESTLFLENIGLIFWLIVMHVAFVFFHLVAVRPLRNSCSFMARLDAKIAGHLYFNGILRFFMEVFFDVAMMSCLNLHTTDWDDLFYSQQASDYLSLSFVILICIVPVATVTIYCMKP